MNSLVFWVDSLTSQEKRRMIQLKRGEVTAVEDLEGSCLVDGWWLKISLLFCAEYIDFEHIWTMWPKDYKFPHISLSTVPRVGLLDPAERSGLIVIVIIII